MNALTVDSYKDMLMAILAEFNPQKIIEFGSGKSTVTLSGVKQLISVEHNKKWFDKIPKGVTGLFCDDYDEYRNAINYAPPYDLVFIDGKERERLILSAREVTDLILVHDAHRVQYKNFFDTYTYQLYNNAGCTVALTDTERTYNALRSRYRKMWN